MPKVSIITAAYNAQPYLEACARSVLDQSFTDFEWILVDDGSTDLTPDIINNLAAQDSRIRVLRHANCGLAASRNAALDHVQGEYFAYLDADDLIHPDLLALCVPILDGNEVDFVSFGFKSVSDEYELKTSPMPTPADLVIVKNPWLRARVRKNLGRNNWNKLYRTDRLGHIRYNPEILRAQDIDYGWRVRKDVKSYAVISNRLYYYRQSKSGVSRQGVTEQLLLSTKQSIVSIHQDYALDPSVPRHVKRFMRARTAKMAYKKLIFGPVKNKNIPLIKLGRVYIKELRDAGIFHPLMLPWKHKIRYVLMHIRSGLLVSHGK